MLFYNVHGYTFFIMSIKKNINYEDIGKEKFVAKIESMIKILKSEGEKELLLDISYCNGCKCNQPVCKFIGNESQKHFALYFEIIENEIVDIFHCNWYDN